MSFGREHLGLSSVSLEAEVNEGIVVLLDDKFGDMVVGEGHITVAGLYLLDITMFITFNAYAYGKDSVKERREAAVSAERLDGVRQSRVVLAAVGDNEDREVEFSSQEVEHGHKAECGARLESDGVDPSERVDD